jgi:hypothetical protein
VAALNAAAHAMRIEHGEVHEGGVVIAGQQFGIGDRVVALHKHGRRGEIVNGTRATITEVDREAVTITVRTDAGAELTLPRQWLQRDRLRHAYALTGHKGQGMTILDAHVFGVSEGKLQEWGYVVMSRHQLDVQLYVVAPEWNEELDRPPRQLAYEPLAELTRSLGQSAAKTLATDQRDGDELAMRRALKMLPPDDLVRVVDAATELLASRPLDRAGELRALTETRATVASAYQHAKAAAREGRTTHGDLERLRARLSAVDTRRLQLEREQHACVRWDQDHAPQLYRAEVAHQELAARHSARRIALEHDPPADLVAELGQPSAHPVTAQARGTSVTTRERVQAPNDVEHLRVRNRTNERLGIGNEVGAEAATAWTEPGQPQGVERTDGLMTDL